ncbi:MAG: winged helix-turn-helix transcriptional regulator [Anaerolineales bacterium]|jgi:DNA-binding MarR family transcriptional regulator
MDISSESSHDLSLLEHIEQDPDITQATLADQLGVAVGTVNWHLKRLIDKGYVKVKRAQRKKLRYIITPSGIALRARLTVEYIERSLQLYRLTRERMAKALEQVRGKGYDAVRLDAHLQGPEDILDICKLTCLEQGIQVVDNGDVPVLEIRGVKVHVRLPEVESERG